MKTLLLTFVLTFGVFYIPDICSQHVVTSTSCKEAMVPDQKLIIDAGPDQNIIYKSGCTTLNGFAAKGLTPYYFAWSPGGSNSKSTEVCPQVTTTYTLTVMDFAGCTLIDSVTVFVLCNAQSEQVRLCHNGQEICVEATSLQAHLNHGDILNECESQVMPIPSINLLKIKALDADHISVYPNPFSDKMIISYTLLFDAWVTLSIYDITGKEIVVFNHGKKSPGIHSIDVFRGNLITGTYYYKLNFDSHTKKHVRTGKLKIIDYSMITHLPFSLY